MQIEPIVFLFPIICNLMTLIWIFKINFHFLVDPTLRATLLLTIFYFFTIILETVYSESKFLNASLPFKPLTSKSRDINLNYRQLSCNQAEATAVARFFYFKNTDNTKCPYESWLVAFRDMSPSSKKVIINIGFNKGYNFALWSSLWVPGSGVDVSVWYDKLNELGVYECGACHDCRARLVKLTRTPRLTRKEIENKLVMIGVDLSAVNVNIVTRVARELNLNVSSTSQTLKIYPIQAGAMDKNGTAWSLKCGIFGDELCALLPDSQVRKTNIQDLEANYDRITVLTVDQLVDDYIANGVIEGGASMHHSKHRNRHIVDILMVDAEGSDPLVLSGAQRLISRGKVRLVVFEYHSKCPWGETSLQFWAERFDRQGYDCYFEGIERLWKITGE